MFLCKIHGEVKAHSPDKYPRCSMCNNERMKRKYVELRARAIEYKGGVCVRCGYDKCPQAFDFHHTDSLEKEFEISRKYTASWPKLKAELDKCILLCANCHREIHAGLVY